MSDEGMCGKLRRVGMAKGSKVREGCKGRVSKGEGNREKKNVGVVTESQTS